jgi:hypothetical protein
MKAVSKQISKFNVATGHWSKAAKDVPREPLKRCSKSISKLQKELAMNSI